MKGTRISQIIASAHDMQMVHQIARKALAEDNQFFLQLNIVIFLYPQGESVQPNLRPPKATDICRYWSPAS